jgi:hypothetical protein
MSRGGMPLKRALARTMAQNKDHGVSILMMNHGMAGLLESTFCVPYSVTLMSLVSNYISFNIEQIVRCYDDIRVRNSLQNGQSSLIVGKEAWWPPIFFRALFYLDEKLTISKIRKNSVMPFFGKCENVVVFDFGNFFLALQNFFIFCIMKVFSRAMQHTKCEHRSPDKIKRYRTLFL